MYVLYLIIHSFLTAINPFDGNTFLNICMKDCRQFDVNLAKEGIRLKWPG
jgi:hypothetical protein